MHILHLNLNLHQKKKKILCFFALPETPSYSNSLAFQCQWGLCIAWQSRVSRTEFFLSITCFMPVMPAAKRNQQQVPGWTYCMLHWCRQRWDLNQQTHVSCHSWPSINQPRIIRAAAAAAAAAQCCTMKINENSSCITDVISVPHFSTTEMGLQWLAACSL